MKSIRLVILSLVIGLWGCEDEPNVNPEGFTEFVVDIGGDWKIDQVLQNGVDVTQFIDFQSFTLQLDYDNGQPSSFLLSDLNAPFILKEANGSWTFDDLTYPTMINFSDGSTLAIEGAVLSGSNELTLAVPLGCGANTYIYRLSK